MGKEKLLIDPFERHISYVRFSITPRCNFNCFYCSSKKGSNVLTKEFNLEDLNFVFSALKEAGIQKLRITGGEPLLRSDITEIVRKAHESKINEIVLTTNGFMLERLAFSLKKAGLTRVNVSLDTLRQDVFFKITGVDSFRSVYNGIFKTLEAGLLPVKINTVLLREVNEEDLVGLANLTNEFPLTVRFIELMPTKGNDAFEKHFLSFEDALYLIEKKFDLEKLSENKDEVASYFKIAGSKGQLGFITPVSQHFCAYCNRLRISSSGKIYPCLFSSLNVDIFDAVKSRNKDLLTQKLFEAVDIKPEKHSLIKENSDVAISNMREIGG